MQIMRDSKTIMNVAIAWPEPELREILSAYVKRLNVYEGYDLCELVNFIVFGWGDTVADLDAALGFPVMTNRSDGSRYREPDFTPSWEVIEEHINWFEVVYVLSDDGFGVVVFVAKNSDAELLQMLQFYSSK